jgi:hypothetical protein
MSITAFCTGGAKGSIFSSSACPGVFRVCLICSLGWDPWSEQKKPCRHLEQESFVAALASGDEVGAATGCFGTDLARTGFSVVCLPVLHLHCKKHLQCLQSTTICTMKDRGIIMRGYKDISYPGISKNKLKS